MIMFERFAVAALAAALMATPAAAQTKIPPFKDELFRYPELTAARDNGAFLDVPYDEVRDIDRRDEIPERRVTRAYVDLAVGRAQDEALSTPDGEAWVSSVGRTRDAELIVVFMHGRNGDRRLGMNDWTFGGNFNRLKNLVVRANGLYVTVDGGALGPSDAERFAAAVTFIADRSPRSRLVLACGSMGGHLCWQALLRPSLAKRVSGVVLLGANSRVGDLDPVLAARGGTPLPLLLGQGARDKVYPLAVQHAFYDAVRRRAAYPIRFVAFDGGNHGTPIRMIDWRDTLNWLLQQR
ncbi:alpha/beta hydrolase family protein [Aureimonas jatrophae]|nr:alpha/beta hydrolase [Aureimonas jatrophae]MBB3951083.1 hypothetical protein [Aureimonas jatrophae]